jgi:hypothetical protein
MAQTIAFPIRTSHVQGSRFQLLGFSLVAETAGSMVMVCGKGILVDGDSAAVKIVKKLVGIPIVLF